MVAVEKNRNIPISSHIKQSLSSVPPQISSQIPTTEVMARQLSSSHGNVRPPLPMSPLELQLPDAYTKTTHNEPFLVHDELLEGVRLLVFVSEFNAHFLCSSLIGSWDETLQTVQKIFFSTARWISSSRINCSLAYMHSDQRKQLVYIRESIISLRILP